MTNNTSSTTPIPNFYRASAADFKKIPGSPIAYWISKNVVSLYDNPLIGSCFEGKEGVGTRNDDVFMRMFWEVSKSNILRERRWILTDKAGDFRRWYLGFSYLMDWENNGYRIKNYRNADGSLKSRPQNTQYLFQEGVSWGKVGSGIPSFRWRPAGFGFNDAAPTLFGKEVFDILPQLNSKVTRHLLTIRGGTINITTGVIAEIPLLQKRVSGYTDVLKNIASSAIQLSKSDWSSYETSWDFTIHPFLQLEYHQPTLSDTYTKLCTHWKEMTLEVQRLEEKNNRIFIEAYGMQDELSPDVPLSEITLTCNPYYRYNGDRSEEELEALMLTDTIKEFISYAVGCMFGRYSLDKPGLVLANQGEKIGDYLEQVPEPSFMPDADNIIPILEDEYFEDDIIGRFKEFLKVTFGEDTLSENLDFIAEALGGNGKKSSEAVIRDYFLKSFYKDHVRMYKKRPIYWLFSSGKGRAFNALIYMHRYNKETLAMMRTDYLLELEGKLDAKREMIKSDIGKDAQEKARLGKMIDEIMEYDELLKNKADEYIEIDLDDGVVVNYARFEGLVEKI